MDSAVFLIPLVGVSAILFALIAVVAPEQLKNPTRGSTKRHTRRKRYRNRTDPYPDSMAMPGESNYYPWYREEMDRPAELPSHDDL